MPRIPLSVTQNFLKESIINNVFDQHVSIPPNLTIVDIGAGTGNITSWLAKHTQNQILAYELDQSLSQQLSQQFSHTNRVVVLNKNFLQTQAPESDFIVVANIPFMYTTAIIKQLTADEHFLEGYLVLQREAAYRFGGHQVKQPSGLQSILLSVDFSFEIQHTFANRDFTPSPNVTSVLLHIKRIPPKVSKDQREDFENFVSYLFNKSVPIVRKAPTLGRYLARKIDLGRTQLLLQPPSALSLDDYLYLFSLCDGRILDDLAGYMKMMREQGESVQKIHRSRTTENWKRIEA